ncbi:hypothetical protein EDB19DRAFT_1644421 [Suillus lakei]|nr:hypothetical protein EDB19DRAFT_1644421 [Suillus lakei]
MKWGFIPERTPPEGWPVLLYIHEGGWTIGSIDTLNSFISRRCNGEVELKMMSGLEKKDRPSCPILQQLG